MNVSQILFNQAERKPDSTAIYYKGKGLSFGDFGSRVMLAAAGLMEAGVVANETVAISLEDPLSHWTATLALAHIGATVISITRSMAEAQREDFMRKTQCSKILVGDDDLAAAENGKSSILQRSLIEQYRDQRWIPHVCVAADHPWIYVRGSGSTGRPKIMPINHHVQHKRAMLGLKWLPYHNDDILLSLVSMHFYAAKQRCLEALAKGTAIFLDTPGRFDHHNEVATGDVTAIYGTVFHIERLLASLPKITDLYYGRLRALIIGGSVVSMRLREQIRERLTPNLYVVWGSNESHTATITRLKDVYKTEGSVGHPFPDVKVEIVDEKGLAVPAGVNGLVRISSAASISQYLGDQEATHKVFRDSYFFPGDIGHFTPDVQLVHCGRADDMMIVSGVNVYPAEVEDCLREVPNVKDAHVLPLRHTLTQDLPVALVVATSSDQLDAESLLKYVRSKIDHHSLYAIIIVNEIPRNEQGKIEHDAVSEIIRSKLASELDAQSRRDQVKKSRDPYLLSLLTFNCRFQLPLNTRAGALKPWLAVLDDQLLSLDAYKASQDVPNNAHIWLDQVLILTIGLLHVLRFPAFQPITILECLPADLKTNNWRAVCRTPIRLLVPNNVLSGAVKFSLKIAEWCLDNDVNTGDNREYFLRAIQEEFLRPFAEQKPNGKSTFEVLRVAHRGGIPYFFLPGGVFQLGWGCQARYIDRSTTDKDSSMGMSWTSNKFLTGQLLRQAGLPSPAHFIVTTLQQAKRAAERIKYPVVIKPVDLDRGEGVSIDVTDQRLELAFNHAQKCSPGKSVLVEQQVPGICYRIFVVCGKLLYAVRRLPIGVYADGCSTIRSLVDSECEKQQLIPPWKRSGIYHLDEEARRMLSLQYLMPDSIPKAGQFVALRRIETTAWGGVDEEVTQVIHPDNVSVAIIAAQVLGLEVAGVDIISRDIKVPWHVNGAVINEVNYAPLLGGGEISRRYIHEYLSRILKNQGRIPVELYVGVHKAWDKARLRLAKLEGDGMGAFLVSDDKIIDSAGRLVTIKSNSLFERVRAMLMRKDVHALIVVVRSFADAQMIDLLFNFNAIQACIEVLD